MEIASTSAPQPTLPKLQLVRNAWLVTILASVALVAAILFVVMIGKQSDAEMFVLIGMAGSAYVVLQCWSLLICTRALRESATFISPYFAAVTSLLLFNAFLLGVYFSKALSIRPIREGLQITALPVLVPIGTLAFFITLPLARHIARRRAISNERSNRNLYGGTLAALILLLMPVPLFVYLAQIVWPGKPHTDKEPPFEVLWRLVIRVTPEFVANAALIATRDTRWYANVLRTGRPSSDQLMFEAHMSWHPFEAMEGLREKDHVLALVAANSLSRATGSMVKLNSVAAAAKIIYECSSEVEQAKFLKDPEVLAEYRDEVYVRRFNSVKYVASGEGSARKVEQKLLEDTARTKGVQLGPIAISAFAVLNEEDVILDVWKSWIQEKNEHRALRRAIICRSLSSELCRRLFVECMEHGSGTMKYAVLVQTNADRIQFEDKDRNLVLQTLLMQLEYGTFHGLEISNAVCRLSGLPRPASMKSIIDPKDLPNFIQQLRAYLGNQQAVR